LAVLTETSNQVEVHKDMRSLRDTEGYFMLDHRHADPVPDPDVHRAGLPPGAGRGLFEAPTFTCSHCQRVVVMNPDRKRERAYCRGCDHLLCDDCGAIRAKTGVCKTWKQVIDELMAQAERQAEADPPKLILP
jgi:hypothetical protein